jgi:hypothetical protein
VRVALDHQHAPTAVGEECGGAQPADARTNDNDIESLRFGLEPQSFTITRRAKASGVTGRIGGAGFGHVH